MQDAITGQVSAYGFVSAVLKTASWVLFDVLFDIPNMDDMLVQMVLNEYVDGFHFILNNKASSFKLQFDSDDIAEYESLVEGFDASCRALLKASEKLTLSSNSSKLVAVKNWHKTFSYDNYIQVVKGIISATPEADRKIKTFSEWTINEATSFTPASDTIEDGHIYKFRDGFYGNIVINTEFNIDSTINIYGSISVNKSLTVNNNVDVTVSEEVQTTGYITIEEGTSLTVGGNIVLSYDGTLTNNGTVNAVDLTANQLQYYYTPTYSQDSPTAVLNLTGNFVIPDSNFSKISAGTVIFSGTTQQTVQGLKAYNVEVLNPEGIKYLSDVSVYGTYDLHGNPLDNAEFVTNLYDQADIVPGANYGDLYIRSEDKTYSYDILCDSITIGYYDYYNGVTYGSKISIDHNAIVTIRDSLQIDYYGGSLTIKDGANVTVGNATIYDYLTIEEGSIFTVEENIVLSYDGTLTNNGTMNAVDLTANQLQYYYTPTYSQDSPTAVLNLTGNFVVPDSDFSKISAGTVIFSGTTQQTVQGLKAYNVEVLNSKGIQYLSNVNVYGNFDAHQNPINMGSYKTNFYDEGGFGTLSENQSDWIISVQPTYTTVGERYKECLVCGEKICLEEIPATGHTAANAVQENRIEPTCTKIGGYDMATYCATCGVELNREHVEIPATGHTAADAVQENRLEPTCTEIGGYDMATYCATCKAELDREHVEIPATGHAHDATVTAPTCTEKGFTTHTCACGDTFVDSYVDALGHTPCDWIVDAEPQIGVEGSKQIACTACGEVLQTETIEALPVPDTETNADPGATPDTPSDTEARTESGTNEQNEQGCNGRISAIALLCCLIPAAIAVTLRKKK